MTVRDIRDRLGLAVCCGEKGLDHEVTGGYTGDLLSDVIAHSKEGNVWVTIQVHANIVAVAVLKDLAAVILANGRTPAPETLAKAMEENMPLLVSTLPAYTLSGQLHALGIGGVA
jgi:serine kinase of HPr protein (carbohydrate metabolism regulator)